jgi:hypothetical protein
MSHHAHSAAKSGDIVGYVYDPKNQRLVEGGG